MKHNKEQAEVFQTSAPESEEIQVIEEESVGKRILNTELRLKDQSRRRKAAAEQ